MRMTQLVASLPDLGVFGQNSVHRSRRAEVTTLLEQRSVHLRHREVGEARLVQDAQHVLSLVIGDSPWRRRAPRSGADRLRALTVEACPGHAERFAGSARTLFVRNFKGGVHASSSSFGGGGGSAIPISCEKFFWISSITSARSTRFLRPTISRFFAANSRSRASTTVAFGPRFFDIRAASSPRLGSLTPHAIRCDEYKPSRRRSAPIAPRSVQ